MISRSISAVAQGAVAPPTRNNAIFSRVVMGGRLPGHASRIGLQNRNNFLPEYPRLNTRPLLTLSIP